MSLDLPKHSTTVENLILNFMERIKKQLILDMESIVQKNYKCSVVFDEWSSIKQRPYLCVFISFQ